MASADITALLNQAAAKYGINPSLLTAIAQQESGLNPTRVSSEGAQGVMQLMPATAQSLGVTNPFDPAQNIDAGARYFSQLLAQYGGNTELALAAYNAGPGNVAKYGGIPPFTETQNYVSSVLAAAGIPAADYASSAGASPADVLSAGMLATDTGSLSTATMLALGLAALLLILAITGD